MDTPADDPSEPSYIDYETFLSPAFSAPAFANTLTLSTNNPSDTPLDLSTPLSRVLFDVQEIDTHIDTLTTRSALPLLEYTKSNAEAGQRVVGEVERCVRGLEEGYARLEREVGRRWEEADEVRRVTERLWETVRLGRSVGRVLVLGRQLEGQMGEVAGGGGGGKREDYRAVVRAANTLVTIRGVLGRTGQGEEGEGLDRVEVVRELRRELVGPAERSVIQRCQQVVREFSMSSLLASAPTSTYAQTEDTKTRATSALLALYLLSPIPSGKTTTTASFEPTLLISTLQDYLQTQLKSSLAALTRALATLPTLDRTLLEISARCQNIVALEALLEGIRTPQPPQNQQPPPNLLSPLLSSLDTSSLPSFFWRSLASALPPRVQDIVQRGGVSARTLRSNRDRVREAVRECVGRGSRVPGRGALKVANGGGWEREAAVMVGSILGGLR
ncbi:hypothetical protein K490DRAFT_75786 [Saccharata proteae CBS 121410]|uniref:Conserved oligomeric Golgi complex subunit 5 n=1 Tax=Saccharata proteae CBS 121410 TaxID=1314787 RepID=A0A9P4HSK9_9PEZI|nr:hypothetical protein K490DRAFT_75786 [Saccharata proteae CBS 121410]